VLDLWQINQGVIRGGSSIKVHLIRRNVISPRALGDFVLHLLIYTSSPSESSTKYCSSVSKGIVGIKVFNETLR
jgi:hypothetical protein